MNGLIAMACGETARFSEPYDSLMNLQRPAGWGFKQFRGMSVAENWNEAARALLSTDAQWLFLTNDDQVYPPNSLLQLLAHGKDAVTGLYLERSAPFAPILYDAVDEEGRVHQRYLYDGEQGLVGDVHACGDGALLLHRRVLEVLGTPPFWSFGAGPMCRHDLLFCAKLRASGISLWCDLDLWVVHLAVMPVSPIRLPNGKWQTALIQTNGSLITLPAAASPLALPAARSPLALV